jgi:hypothetical protein
MKRKPGDIVYAFLEYSTHEEASEAVSKYIFYESRMDKTIFFKRTLNVKFGIGGKHQQSHYEALSVYPKKNRDYHSRDR